MMIVLGEGWPEGTSLGLFLPRPPRRQVSPFTSVGAGGCCCGAFRPPHGAPPSSGPSGTACSCVEGGRIALTACVHLPHRRCLVPATETVSPLAKPPKFALLERSA